MKELVELVDELMTRTKTKRVTLSQSRADFHRKCIAHFKLFVLPQFDTFESHLTSQGATITIEPLFPMDENVLEAALVAEHEIRVAVLVVRYDFKTLGMTFGRAGALDRTSLRDCQTFPSLDDVKALLVYDIVAEFLSKIFEVTESKN